MPSCSSSDNNCPMKPDFGLTVGRFSCRTLQDSAGLHLSPLGIHKTQALTQAASP